MSEMVERAAEAIYRSQEWDFASDEQFADLTNGAKEIFRISARAAITAMRPTEAELKAAGCDDDTCGAPYSADCSFLAEQFGKYIDAALK